jgi:hypothetical protein
MKNKVKQNSLANSIIGAFSNLSNQAQEELVWSLLGSKVLTKETTSLIKRLDKLANKSRA